MRTVIDTSVDDLLREPWLCPVCKEKLEPEVIKEQKGRILTTAIGCDHCELMWERYEDEHLGPQEQWRLVNAHPRLRQLMEPT